jgi:hypothetical protein
MMYRSGQTIRVDVSCECGTDIRLDCVYGTTVQSDQLVCPVCRNPLRKRIPGCVTGISFRNRLGTWIRSSAKVPSFEEGQARR